jgi:muramoyltetrapeptide carboxypeptidase LdcA involved in peptidoglycan recycling
VGVNPYNFIRRTKVLPVITSGQITYEIYRAFVALRDIGCPVVADFPCGHVRDNVTLPLGARVTLDADAGTLEVIEPSCLPRSPAAH